ncbi:DgyrCDS8551 [Dimorphilus gyrociliatus]|uniref:DgyrCDS8551 n=1 Tax=Dimorphilus gyrociliatus TaxID=2664684 RepID=A0A7I8VWP1_9ANNE|nr:DgyrCDS8551 [Dimorphilus gyrociliatus]
MEEKFYNDNEEKNRPIENIRKEFSEGNLEGENSIESIEEESGKAKDETAVISNEQQENQTENVEYACDQNIEEVVRKELESPEQLKENKVEPLEIAQTETQIPPEISTDIEIKEEVSNIETTQNTVDIDKKVSNEEIDKKAQLLAATATEEKKNNSQNDDNPYTVRPPPPPLFDDTDEDSDWDI